MTVNKLCFFLFQPELLRLPIWEGNYYFEGEMNQQEAILYHLSDRKWHHVVNLMERVAPGAVNCALRSRISDLNHKLPERGLYIYSRIAADGQAEYRLGPDGELSL